jgi:hypothetical protein
MANRITGSNKSDLGRGAGLAFGVAPGGPTPSECSLVGTKKKIKTETLEIKKWRKSKV